MLSILFVVLISLLIFMGVVFYLIILVIVLYLAKKWSEE